MQIDMSLFLGAVRLIWGDGAINMIAKSKLMTGININLLQ